MNAYPGRAAAPWFQCYRPVPVATARLACFPHAGGSASFFRPWADELPADVELLAAQYPGREDRLREPPVTDLGELADRYADVLRATDVPLVLFGHSLGAAVGYEVARRLVTAGAPPALLVVSGRQAPFDPSRAVHLMDDDALWADVARAGGTSRAVLESPELRALVLPVLRADYRLSETYRPSAGPPLTCPVLAVSGDADPDVDLAVLPGWGTVTTAGCEVRVFPGDHFFLQPHRRALVGEIVRRLRARTDAWATP
ncbi:pyochelin biosynthetic protein PchC [Micromonospora echinaurantiaca]|uniref:Pyochelin biosynthetic protein PchC n=1 Tax=Micromonospora echinaurantiaca TaxID=47857 RepID=A0A1C5HM18_9ACTN|nr:alpha/beta fold hydrolase [Micromonospora echinaurantiaca]SCG46621.1 pyochelin biosynthetic protein PchC [Micromonospora echinaurantiaca]